MARELHDGVCQSLISVTFLLETHLRQLRESGNDSKPLQSGGELRDMLAGTLQEMRGLSHGLSGVETGAQGEKLPAALSALAERVNASGSVRCTVVCPDLPALGQTNATHLYRLVQEAISNALRHAQAEQVEVRLARTGGRWQLTVTDDGVGVSSGTAPDGGGLGMRSMQYRAAVLGGTLEVRRASAAGERPGTMVRCTFA